MFNNIAFDVVIGLIFIYLLYSLLATVLAEIFSTQMGLRAYNLKEAIDRMLNDEDVDKKKWYQRLWDSLNIRKNPDNDMVRNFYNHPEIKYLGSTGIFKTPSSFKAESFSKTILYALNGPGETNKDNVKSQLKKLSEDYIIVDSIPPNTTPSTNELKLDEIILDKEAAKYVMSLLDDSFGDLVKFKLYLEAWFNRTMEQSLEWYKRKIQFILMVIGFMMAWCFNADTFAIVKKLSKDDKAREQIVSMANAYVENNKEKFTSASSSDSNVIAQENKAKLDSLLQVKKELEKDVAKANSILGLGGWPPDKVMVSLDNKTTEKVYTPMIDGASLPEALQAKTSGQIVLTNCEKWSYFFSLFCNHFFGFLITAIAISLGAPFWFDLLNKLMKLRTANKYDTDKDDEANANQPVSPLKRVG